MPVRQQRECSGASHRRSGCSLRNNARVATDERGDSPEPLARDFGPLPTTGTRAGARFFNQHHADLLFIASETLLVNELERLVAGVSEALRPGQKAEEAFPNLWGSVERSKRANKKNWRVRREIAISRYVDSYLVYIAELVGDLFRVRPEALRSEETVRLVDILQHQSLEDFIGWAADERVNRLTYDGFAKISTFVENRFGLVLVDDPDLRQRVVEAIAIRNLLVHRRGVVDARFLKSLKDEGLSTEKYVLGETIRPLEHFEVMVACYESVVAIEAKAIAKFGLVTQPMDAEATWRSIMIGPELPSADPESSGEQASG